MFYIDTHHLLKKSDRLFMQILPTVVVFLFFFVIVMFSWGTAKNNVIDEQTQSLARNNTETAAKITARMEIYEDILRGGAGLYYAKGEVSSRDWREFLAPYALTERYPGIQGVGYAQVVLHKDKAAHEAVIRKNDLPNYAIYPSGVRSSYTAIIQVEPTTNRNKQALGYDMASDPVRQATLEKARDSGTTTATPLLTLVQEKNETTQQPGFLLYLPIYRGSSQPATLAERRQSVRGYAYLPFRTYDLIENAVNSTSEHYGFTVWSDLPSDETLMYTSAHYDKLKQSNDAQRQTTTIDVAGSRWYIEGVVNRSIVNNNISEQPDSVLQGGILFCVIIAAFLYVLLGNRTRAFRQEEERSIQEAKDELLALASHQLRTPATGVKQYVGMLREGFAGSLTKTQQTLLDKAYDSNERQLGTINEMLFVARSDAGHLRLDNQEIDIAAMTKDIVDEQRAVIKQREQAIRVNLPKHAVTVCGDKQYLRMALENIVSNATKYTRKGGRIIVSVKSIDNNAIFTVKDTGVGVAKQQQKLLFKKFSRIPNELTNQVVGSGIGLYLAKRVVDGHQGTITFESNENVGSLVTITLPKATTKKRTAAKKKKSTPRRQD